MKKQVNKMKLSEFKLNSIPENFSEIEKKIDGKKVIAELKRGKQHFIALMNEGDKEPEYKDLSNE